MSSIPRTHEQCRPGDGSPTPKISVVILTLNEEINIAECIESCSWSDDVHVLLQGRLGDHLRRLMQPGVDHLHAVISQHRRDRLGTPIVSVQTGLADEDADLSLRHG